MLPRLLFTDLRWIDRGSSRHAAGPWLGRRADDVLDLYAAAHDQRVALGSCATRHVRFGWSSR